MSVSSEVQRTLVKSPPELWAELSDPAFLASHLGELGEIRIVRTVPETTVEWEAPEVTGSVQIKPSAWGTKVTLTVTQELSEELSAPEPQTPSELLAAKPSIESGHGTAVSPGTQSTRSRPDPETRREAGQPLPTTEGASHGGPASEQGVNPEPTDPQAASQPAVDAGSEGPPQVDPRPGADPRSVGVVEAGLQPAAVPAAESAVQGGLQPSADAKLESAKSEPELQQDNLAVAGDLPEGVPIRREGLFARAWRRLRWSHRVKPPSATAESAQSMGDAQSTGDAHSMGDAQSVGDTQSTGDAQPMGDAQSTGDAQSMGDLVVPEPTAVAPDESASEAAPPESGDDQAGGEKREPERGTTRADNPPWATGATPEAVRSELSGDAIAGAQTVRTAGTTPEAARSEPSGDAIADSQGREPTSASSKETAVESLASERATAVLTSMLDRLGAAHHRPFSRG